MLGPCLIQDPRIDLSGWVGTELGRGDATRECKSACYSC